MGVRVNFSQVMGCEVGSRFNVKGGVLGSSFNVRGCVLGSRCNVIQASLPRHPSARGAPGGGSEGRVLRVAGDDGELRPWYYIYLAGNARVGVRTDGLDRVQGFGSMV